MKKVFTFYSPVEGKVEKEELALIDLWKRSWLSQGWEPVVLSYESLDDSPELRELMKEFKRLPSINKYNLDYWCYLRWVAVAQQGGGFMCDYDVINYSFSAREVGPLTVYCSVPVGSMNDNVPIWRRPLRALRPAGGDDSEQCVPCLVSGSQKEFMRAVHWFASEPVGIVTRLLPYAHTSDMLILKNHSDEFVQRRDCVEYDLPGWEGAAVVHYSNNGMKPKGFVPRHEHIVRLRPFNAPAATI
jgi:hypothetical protein